MSLQAARRKADIVTLQPGLQRTAVKAPVALTLGLLAFFLANAFLLNGLIWSVSPEPHRATVLKHSWDVLRGEGGDDSWGAMQVALDHVAEMPEHAALQQGVLHRQFPFPVSALGFVRPHGHAGRGPGAGADQRRL